MRKRILSSLVRLDYLIKWKAIRFVRVIEPPMSNNSKNFNSWCVAVYLVLDIVWWRHCPYYKMTPFKLVLKEIIMIVDFPVAFSKVFSRDEEMVKQLRVFSGIPEDLISIPSIHVTNLQLPLTISRGSDIFFWPVLVSEFILAWYPTQTYINI